MARYSRARKRCLRGWKCPAMGPMAERSAMPVRADVKNCLGCDWGRMRAPSFWLPVFTELHNRGIKDIFIACVDGLTGLPEAIETLYPHTRPASIWCAIRSNRKNGSREYCRADENQRACLVKRFWTGGPLRSLSNGRLQAAWMKEASPVMCAGSVNLLYLLYSLSDAVEKLFYLLLI